MKPSLRFYIQFPAGIAQGELPPLFVIGAQGDGQLAKGCTMARSRFTKVAN